MQFLSLPNLTHKSFQANMVINYIWRNHSPPSTTTSFIYGLLLHAVSLSVPNLTHKSFQAGMGNEVADLFGPGMLHTLNKCIFPRQELHYSDALDQLIHLLHAPVRLKLNTADNHECRLAPLSSEMFWISLFAFFTYLSDWTWPRQVAMKTKTCSTE